MRKLARDTEVLAFIARKMPSATHEEQIQASHEFWEFFDAIWAIADRLVTEEENAHGVRDKSTALGILETPPIA